MRSMAIVALLLLILALMTFAWMRSRLALPAAGRRPQPAPTVPVALAAHDIPVGKQVTHEDIEVVQKQQAELAELPADTLREPWDFLGGRAVAPIAKGGCFTRANLKPPPRILAEKVAKGFVAMELPRSDPRSVTGLRLIDLDDRVDVLGVRADAASASGAGSTKLAENVRLVAINRILDRFKEVERLKQLDRAIAEKKAGKERYQKGAAAPDPLALRVMDAEIAKLQEDMDPFYKQPFITLEVTAEQARKIAEYRLTGKIALLVHHRERVDW
ncbi:MAG: hypothetical protein HYU66_21115 [Armatimonadetes bacterium]|nr:hypothetical protein [Armatimonadota bacterium]